MKEKKQCSFKGKGTYKKAKYIIMLFILIPIMLFGAVMTLTYHNHLQAELGQKREYAYEKVVSDVNKQFGEITTVMSLINTNQKMTYFLANDNIVYAEDKTEEGIKKSELVDTVSRIYKSGLYYRTLEIYSFAADSRISSDGNGYGSELLASSGGNHLDKTTDGIYDNGKYIMINKTLRAYNNPAGILSMQYNKIEFAHELGLDKNTCDMSVRLLSEDGETVFSSGDVKGAYSKSAKIPIANARVEVAFGEKESKLIATKTATSFAVCLLLSLAAAYILSSICTSVLYKRIINKPDRREDLS